MKYWLLCILFPLYGYSQTMPDTCFTEQEIHDISETLDSLFYRDSINEQIISEQTSIIVANKRVTIRPTVVGPIYSIKRCDGINARANAAIIMPIKSHHKTILVRDHDPIIVPFIASMLFFLVNL